LPYAYQVTSSSLHLAAVMESVAPSASFHCSTGELLWGQLDIVLESRRKARFGAEVKYDGALGDKKPRGEGTVFWVEHHYRCKALTGEWRKYMYSIYSKEYKADFPFMVICHEDYTPKEIVNKSMKVSFDWKPDWDAEVIYCNRYDWGHHHENEFSERWKANGNSMFLVDPSWSIEMEATLFGIEEENAIEKEKEEATREQRKKEGAHDGDSDESDDDDYYGPLEDEEEEFGDKYDDLEDSYYYDSDTDETQKKEEERKRQEKLELKCNTLDRLETLKAKHEVMDESSKSVKLLDANDKVCGLYCNDFDDGDGDWIYAKLVFDSNRKLIGYVGWDSLDEVFDEFNEEMNK